MTDKKTKKEKPGYEIEYLRRATVDDDYNYSEWRVKFNTAKIDGMTVVRDTEKMVDYVRESITAKKPKVDSIKDIGETLVPEISKALKRAAKKKPAPVKEAGDTEDIKIADLKHGDKVNISVKLVEAIDPKEDIKSFISKADGSAGRYVKFDVTDDSGTMKLTLFGDQVDLMKGVKANAWLALENAYCKDYKGKLELSIAYGKMDVVYNG